MSDDDTHECPAPPCAKRVARRHFACPQHWYMLPEDKRKAISAAFRAGTAAEHLAAMAVAVRWYELQLCPDEPGQRYNLTVARPPLAATKRNVPIPPPHPGDETGR